MSTIHQNKVGTFHPAETIETQLGGAQWTIHDSRGTMDGGPACDECGACECMLCADSDGAFDACRERHRMCQCDQGEEMECVGLNFAFVCLDGGDTLCCDCAEKAGVEIVPCDYE